MKLELQTFTAWAHIVRSEDTAGWIAYCPEFDVMTMGDSVEHARAMVEEAVVMTIQDDLNRGFDPNGRRSSDDEDWAGLNRLFESHKVKVPVGQLDERQDLREFAVPLTWTFQRWVSADDGDTRDDSDYPTARDEQKEVEAVSSVSGPARAA
jgi:predicted RNase H-like HicB family nuclease